MIKRLHIPQSTISEDFIPNVRQRRFIPKLRDMTKTFIKMITPKIPTKEFGGGVKCIPFTIIGSMEYGKTETAKIITKLVIEKYGEENVNPIISTSLDSLMTNMDSKDVQMLIVDDSGTRSEKELNEVIKKFIIIRHEYGKIRITDGKKKAGVVIICFTSQSLFLLKKKLRTHFRATILKSSYDNKYDKDTMINMVGKEGFKMLQQITKKVSVLHDKSGLDFSVIKINGYEQSGIVNFKYDSEEAEIIPWKIIEEKLDIGNTSITDLTEGYNSDVFGDLRSYFIHHIQKASKIPKLKLEMYYDKHILGKSIDDMNGLYTQKYETRKGHIRSVKKFLKSGSSNNVKGQLSEKWFVKELTEALRVPLAVLWQCEDHGTKDGQSFSRPDICLHTEDGQHLLSINMKFFSGEGNAQTLHLEPECFTPRHAVCMLETIYQQTKNRTLLRFKLLKEEEERISSGKIPVVREKGTLSLFQVIAEQIEQLVEQPEKKSVQPLDKKEKTPNKTKKPKKKPVEKTKVPVTKSNKNDSKKLRNKK